jgi:hypothetical protein
MKTPSKELCTQIWKIDQQLRVGKKLNANGQPKGKNLTPEKLRKLHAQREALVKSKAELAEKKLQNQTSAITDFTMQVGKNVVMEVGKKIDDFTAKLKLGACPRTKTREKSSYIGCAVENDGIQCIVEKMFNVPKPDAPWQEDVQYLLIRKDCFDEYKKKMKEADSSSAVPPSKSLKYEKHAVVTQEVFSDLVKDLYAPGVVVRTAGEHLTIPEGWVGKLLRKSKASWKIQFVVNGREVVANCAQANVRTTFVDADEVDNEYSEEFLRGKVVTFIKEGQQHTRPTGRSFLLKGVEGRSEGFQTKNT